MGLRGTKCTRNVLEVPLIEAPSLYLPLLAGLAAAAGSYAVTPLVIRWACSRGLYCRPGGRHIHREPVPRLGGVAIVAGVTVGLAVAIGASGAGFPAWDLTRPMPGVLAALALGGGMVFLAGLVDDVRGIRPRTKVAVQVAAALVVYAMGVRVEFVSLAGLDLVLGWLALPATVLWIVGISNAYNLVDGMDGLAAGLGIVAFGAIATAAGLLGNFEVLVIAAVLLGALAGFLPRNFNPARIFMGDSGSLFIGFVLAVVAVEGSLKSQAAVLVVVPLFALAVPLLDTFAAMLRRWLRCLPISTPDARHIHHRLVALGLSHRDAVLVLYVAGAGFAAAGMLLAFAPDGGLLVITVVGGIASAAVVYAGMRSLRYDEFLLAGKVLASWPRRARAVIRTRIVAADVAASIRGAGSMEEIADLLQEGATKLGLLRMEVGSASMPALQVLEHTDSTGAPGASWTVCFPLCEQRCSGDAPVLRLHVPVLDVFGTVGAERVAPMVAAALRERFDMLCDECRLRGGEEWQEPVLEPAVRLVNA
jgi:UDP-GlcNAc:undecaprenyl-phosphate/decaprenyl-phosphate GlcNAc-1-phosphate transferase